MQGSTLIGGASSISPSSQPQRDEKERMRRLMSEVGRLFEEK